ncbi:hypothetical protein DB29_02303 [Shouchella clausii]|nr:hypothetical protein DB29_02303 [Shouchella clausii]
MAETDLSIRSLAESGNELQGLLPFRAKKYKDDWHIPCIILF